MSTDNTTHTPGPWVVEAATLIWSPSAKKMVAGASACEPRSGFVEYEPPQTISLDEPAANARLIAAAPDLLAALEDLVRLADRAMILINDELADACDTIEFYAARSAIANARGNQR